VLGQQYNTIQNFSLFWDTTIFNDHVELRPVCSFKAVLLEDSL